MVICFIYYLDIALYKNSKVLVFKHYFIFFLACVKKGCIFMLKSACIKHKISVIFDFYL